MYPDENGQWLKAEDMARRDEEMHIMAEQLVALSTKGSEAERIACELLALLEPNEQG